MKTALKIFALIGIVILIMTSCEAGFKPSRPGDHEHPPVLNPNDWYELHHNIRPTKPIRIPDTMRIVTAKPITYNIPQDSVPELPKDSIPQDTIAY